MENTKNTISIILKNCFYYFMMVVVQKYKFSNGTRQLTTAIITLFFFLISFSSHTDHGSTFSLAAQQNDERRQNVLQCNVTGLFLSFFFVRERRHHFVSETLLHTSKRLSMVPLYYFIIMFL